MKRTDTVTRVTDYTFAAVSDLASYANDLEEIGYILQAEKLRRISSELENISHTILKRSTQVAKSPASRQLTSKKEERTQMKMFRITYFLKPEADNITITITAKSYEDACIWAKGFRRESFSCTEIK